jgi:hypothetical protein
VDLSVCLSLRVAFAAFFVDKLDKHVKCCPVGFFSHAVSRIASTLMAPDPSRDKFEIDEIHASSVPEQ